MERYPSSCRLHSLPWTARSTNSYRASRSNNNLEHTQPAMTVWPGRVFHLSSPGHDVYACLLANPATQPAILSVRGTGEQYIIIFPIIRSSSRKTAKWLDDDWLPQPRLRLAACRPKEDNDPIDFGWIMEGKTTTTRIFSIRTMEHCIACEKRERERRHYFTLMHYTQTHIFKRRRKSNENRHSKGPKNLLPRFFVLAVVTAKLQSSSSYLRQQQLWKCSSSSSLGNGNPWPRKSKIFFIIHPSLHSPEANF